MAGFSSIANYVRAIEDDGKYRITSWRKSPVSSVVAGVWFDLSTAPGNPVPNYYASSPGVAAVLNGNDGIFHGGAVAPATKRLKRFTAMTATANATPLHLIVMDYLLYYPFLDMGSNDDQALVNGVSLPRYVSGAGVQVMAVMTNPQATGGATFNFTYTNQDGVGDRLSQTVTCGATVAAGTLINTAQATAGASSPFIPLQDGDTGVRSIETFRMVAGVDVGLIALVLVKPLADARVREITAPGEVDYLMDSSILPAVEDGAYLNAICLGNASLSGTAIHGLAEFIWN